MTPVECLTADILVNEPMTGDGRILCSTQNLPLCRRCTAIMFTSYTLGSAYTIDTRVLSLATSSRATCAPATSAVYGLHEADESDEAAGHRTLEAAQRDAIPKTSAAQ